ncbi:G-protein coupled receptor-associated sorting protein 1 isoform X2 [Cervus elaphus]|uniref:G-protein coupled receptor-associated sorting protein 1 isoform X2 n=1 Tax=Cervus elaphus TaxID=9860 RepID=UPI001CC311D9|nr:G-protein coupled receptor-associated sorting protein 1 isoform X2 [Cervus elaphus]
MTGARKRSQDCPYVVPDPWLWGEKQDCLSSEWSVLQPAHPLLGLAPRCSGPHASLLFYPHAERWEAKEKLRPEWEDDHRDLAPPKACFKSGHFCKEGKEEESGSNLWRLTSSGSSGGVGIAAEHYLQQELKRPEVILREAYAERSSGRCWRRPSLRLVTSARKERRKRLKSLKICMLLQNPLTISCPAGVLGLLGQPAVCLRLNTTGTKQGEEDCATLVQIDFHWQLWWCWNCC